MFVYCGLVGGFGFGVDVADCFIVDGFEVEGEDVVADEGLEGGVDFNGVVDCILALCAMAKS